MKASRFTDAQKAYILKQGEAGLTVAEVRPHGAIGNKCPITLMKPGGETSPSPG
jgi:hypothetical protein